MRKKLTKKEWERKKRIKVISVLGTSLILALGVLSLFCVIMGRMFGVSEKDVISSFFPTKKVGPVDVTEMFLTKNPYSRPGTALKKVKGVVIHYTANPGTDAEANRSYFENLKDSGTASVSSHYIIGLDGKIIQCIPLDEVAYASNNRNEDTISIECCHNDKTGKFTKKTLDSLIKLTAWLCGEYNLKQDDILRHYDVTGKDCPRYFVKHEDEWNKFGNNVFQYIDREQKKKPD